MSTTQTSNSYFPYLNITGWDIAKKCFNYSIEKLKKIQELISRIGNQNNLVDDLSLYAFSYLAKGTKPPLDPDRHLSAVDFLLDASPHYFRSQGGATLKLYKKLMMSGEYSFLFNNTDTVELIKGERFRNFLKLKYPTIRIGSSKPGTPKSFDEQLKYLEKYNSVSSTQKFLDVSPMLLQATNPSDLEARIKKIKLSIKKNPNLKNEIIGAFLKLKDGQDIYILFSDSTTEQTKKAAAEISDLRMCSGYIPDMVQIRKNLLKGNLPLNDLFSLISPKLKLEASKSTNSSEKCEIQIKTKSLFDTLLKKVTESEEGVEKCYFTLFATFLSSLSPRLDNESLKPAEKELVLFALTEMEAILKNMTSAKTNYLTFLSEIDLLAEEITCLLIVAKASKSFITVLNETGISFKAEGTSKKESYFFTSAMNAINHILGAQRKQQNSNSYQTTKSKVGFTHSSYFETKLYVKPNLKEVFKVVTPDSLERIDMFFMDIYPNDPTLAEAEKIEPIKTILGLLKTASRKPLTVVIDTSTMEPDSSEIQKILDNKEIQKAINLGFLNLVTVCSLAKFGMAGLDKYSGGVIQTYNSGQFFKPFNDYLIKMQAKESPSPEADSFFSLFFTCGKELIKNYHKYIIDQTNYVYKKLISLKLQTPGAKLSLAKRDGNIPMLSFQLDNVIFALSSKTKTFNGAHEAKTNLAKILDQYIYGLAKKMGLPLDNRPSFGFPVSSINASGPALRLTVGFEKAEILEGYVNLLSRVNWELESALKNQKFENALLSTTGISKRLCDDTERLKILQSMTDKTSLEQFMGI